MDTDGTQSTVPRSRLSIFLENVFYIIIAAGLALLVQAYIARPFIVNGTSMDPTFNNSDYLIIDEITYRFREPQRGEVLVFKSPPEPKKYYIKRIIGLPGETVKIEGEQVTIINTTHPEGIILKEDYVLHPQPSTKTFTVPENQYFVMGDNRAGSYDSRSWGGVPKENIRGRALLRLLPLQHINVLPGNEDYE